MKIGQEEVRKAREIYNKYKEGKANLDKRIVENERWFRLQHWKGLRKGVDRKQTAWYCCRYLISRGYRWYDHLWCYEERSFILS